MVDSREFLSSSVLGCHGSYKGSSLRHRPGLQTCQTSQVVHGHVHDVSCVDRRFLLPHGVDGNYSRYHHIFKSELRCFAKRTVCYIATGRKEVIYFKNALNTFYLRCQTYCRGPLR